MTDASLSMPPEQAQPEVPDWLIENITEASKNARNIYLLYTGLLAYCILTLLGITDRHITLHHTVLLPIINLEVPLKSFCMMVPLLAIFAFVYLQAYLHRVKLFITDLRLHYEPIDERCLYPWMINIAEAPNPGPIGQIQRLIVTFVLWGLLPIVLLLLVCWFMKIHDPVLSYTLGTLSIGGTCIVLWFWCQYDAVTWQRIHQHNIGKILWASVVIVLASVLIFIVIPWAHEGSPAPGPGIKQALARYLRSWTVVDLSYQNLVTDPGIHHANYPWVNLYGARLEGANLTATILTQADLRTAHLQRAQISSALLDRAFLWGAHLQYANLNYSSLQAAYLKHANLQHASLNYSNLQEAYLKFANLQHASLIFANLQGADLEYAQLQEADLTQANLQNTKGLTLEQLSRVKTLYKAQLDAPLQAEIGQAYPLLLETPQAEQSTR